MILKKVLIVSSIKHTLIIALFFVQRSLLVMNKITLPFTTYVDKKINYYYTNVPLKLFINEN